MQKRETLAKINLGCYQQIQDRPTTETFYAEILQVCADVDLANAARSAETAAEAARPVLEGARDSALLALKILRPYLDDERKALGQSVFEATRPRKLFEVQEQLLARARSGSGGIAQNLTGRWPSLGVPAAKAVRSGNGTGRCGLRYGRRDGEAAQRRRSQDLRATWHSLSVDVALVALEL